MMSGSILQQDVPQRVTAAKSERIAVWSTVLVLAVSMSTASGTLLAPSVTISKNILKGWLDGSSALAALLQFRGFCR